MPPLSVSTIVSYGMFVGLGKEMSPIMGWRAALRFNHNKSRNVQKCELADTWGWNSLEFFGDATFDITDALFHKPMADGEKRVFNLKAFAELGRQELPFAVACQTNRLHLSLDWSVCR